MIADYPISVQIEKWVHSVLKQYLKIYSLVCAKSLQEYVEMFALNNDIRNVRVHLVKPDLCGIKVGCHFLGHPVYTCFRWRTIIKQ